MAEQDLSITGAAMGVLTAVGHATDSIVNAVGLVVLLFARRKVNLRIRPRMRNKPSLDPPDVFNVIIQYDWPRIDDPED